MLLVPFGFAGLASRVGRGLFNFPKAFLLRFLASKNEGPAAEAWGCVEIFKLTRDNIR